MKNTKNVFKKNGPYQHKSIKEKSFDEVGFKHDISEEYRDSTVELKSPPSDTRINMSEAQDRSEDLINEVDHFTQEPESVRKTLRISERSL